MTILDRYILKGFLTMLVLSVIVLGTMFLVISIVDSLDWMMARGNVPFDLILRYYLALLPYAMYMMVPLNALFSALITLGMMSQRNEITVIKAGGISIYRLATPIFLCAVVLSGLMYWFGDSVVPAANGKVHELDQIMFHNRTKEDFRTARIWYVSERIGEPPWIYRIVKISPENDSLEGFTLFKLDESFKAEKMIHAATAEYRNGSWILYNAIVNEYPQDAPVLVGMHDSLDISLPETAGDFMVLKHKPGEMTVNQLRAHIERVHRYGIDSKDFEVELESRRSLPVASIIMVILGIPFALRGVRDQGLAKGILAAVVIGFAYYIFTAEALSLGRNGTFSPAVAAWVSNVIFGLVGVILFTGTRS